MKSKLFYDREHARLYLTGSIILHKQCPIYVHSISVGRKNYDYILDFSYLNSPIDRIKDSLLSRQFDFNPIKMGLVTLNNKDKGYHYSIIVFRIPARRYKIGLYRANTKITKFRRFDNIPDWNIVVYSKGFVDAAMGIYPSYKEATLLAQPKGSLIPFSRRFAVDSIGNLYYINFPQNKVGCLIKDELTLSDEYRHLSQVLKKDTEK